MRVRDAMSTTVLTVGPGHTLRQVSQLMSERNIGSAVVLDPDGEGPGIVTERDILRAIAAGEDPDTARVEGHHADEVTPASPDWTLEQAADTMIRSGFRHLVVFGEDQRVAGVVSMRDIVRMWSREHRGATTA